MNSKLMLTAAAAVLALTASAATAAPAAYIAAAIADPGRKADSARDADRKPTEMLEFAGVKPGQTVVDLLPGGGYFTRIFSKAVGPDGAVYAVSPPPRVSTDPAKPTPTPASDLIAADPAYANVKSIHQAPSAFSTPTKADLVWTSQNYHDLHNIKGLDMIAFDKAVFDSLKPGGVFVILDHIAAAGSPADVTSTLHRIEPAVVRKEAEAAGFKFAGESKVLANPADDHTKGPFDPSLRGHTDQFIYKFRKPK